MIKWIQEEDYAHNTLEGKKSYGPCLSDLGNNFFLPLNVVIGLIQRRWRRHIHQVPEKFLNTSKGNNAH